MDTKILCFLQSKGVYKNEQNILTAKCAYMNHPELIPDQKTRQFYEDARKRLDCLISSNSTFQKNKNEEEKIETWDDFTSKVKLWDNKEESFVIWRDHRDYKEDVLVQIHQPDGSSYINAPIVLQHYLISMDRGRFAGVKDIFDIINGFSADQLTDYIFNESGNSVSLLKNILQKNTRISTCSLADIDRDFLSKYGPTLVTGFQTDENFKNGNKSSYVNISCDNSTSIVDTTSMLICGCRVENNKTYYLLQNWWNQKQFIEVDYQYMESCNPFYYYVQTPQRNFSSNTKFIYIPSELEKPSTRSTKEGPIGYKPNQSNDAAKY